MKTCVIGLGYFGKNLVVDLVQEGHEVLALDISEGPVDELKDVATLAARADASDIHALKKLGVQDMDYVIVAIGENFESSLMVVGHLKELKVPRIVCRVINPVHERILTALGVDEKVQPEALAARQLAKRLGVRGASRHFALDRDFAIIELAVPEAMIGKTLSEVGLRVKFALNLVTIKRFSEEQGEPSEEGEGEGAVVGVPRPDTRFEAGDRLIIFGREVDIARFSGRQK